MLVNLRLYYGDLIQTFNIFFQNNHVLFVHHRVTFFATSCVLQTAVTVVGSDSGSLIATLSIPPPPRRSALTSSLQILPISGRLPSSPVCLVSPMFVFSKCAFGVDDYFFLLLPTVCRSLRTVLTPTSRWMPLAASVPASQGA